jgi:AAA domain
MSLTVTLFRDQAATVKDQRTFTSDDLSNLIRSTYAAAKSELPWLKLARFGNGKSDKGSLRHDRNVIAITGIEADYDGGSVSFDEAVEIAEKAGLHAILYTSPSHTPDRPRWRILCPTSREFAPDRRPQLLDRVNGLYRGIFAAESWTLSQSYYFGSVKRNPVHRVEIVDGQPIDALDELDPIAIGKPQTKSAPGNGAAGAACGPVDEKALLELIRTGEAYHTAAMRLLGAWARQGLGLVEAERRLRAAFEDVFPPERDDRWGDRVATIPEMLSYVYGKEAGAKETPRGGPNCAADGESRPPRPNGRAPGQNSNAPNREIQLVDFDAIEARLDWAWLVEGLLMPEQISIVWGAPGCRKTFMCLDLALHVAASLAWLGRRVEPGLVVYVAAEAGNTIRQRIAAWKIEHPDVRAIPFAIVPHSIDLCHAAAGDCDALIQKILHKAAGRPIGLLVIDTVNRSLGGGNENAPEDMGAFSMSLDRFRDQLGAHALGVHHCGKNPALGPRGHSLLEGNVDTEIEVSADDATPTSTVTVHKQRDADKPPPFSFGLKPVILGTNQAGQIITSCIVTPAELAPRPKQKTKAKLPHGAQTALNALIKAIDKHGTDPPASNDIPRSARGVPVDTWRMHFYAAVPAEDEKEKAARKTAFWRAMRALQETDPPSVCIAVDFAWLPPRG